MKDIKIFISSFLILTSFFAGIFFERTGQQKNPLLQNDLSVNLIEKSNGLEIIKSNEKIQISVNNIPLNGTGFILDKKTKK